MIRRCTIMALAYLMAPVLTVLLTGCPEKDKTPRKTVCQKLRERNLKCAHAVTKVHYSRLDKRLSEDLKTILSRRRTSFLNKGDFGATCRRVTGAKYDRAHIKRKALLRCTTENSCDAYADCFLTVWKNAVRGSYRRHIP